MKNTLFFMVFSCSLFVCNHGCPRQTVRRRSRRNSVSLRRVFRIRSDPEKDLQRKNFLGRGAAGVKSAAFRKAKRPQNAPCRDERHCRRAQRSAFSCAARRTKKSEVPFWVPRFFGKHVQKRYYCSFLVQAQTISFLNNISRMFFHIKLCLILPPQ